jgi:flagellar biosynthesis/type III secretory pathway protein FliH
MNDLTPIPDANPDEPFAPGSLNQMEQFARSVVRAQVERDHEAAEQRAREAQAQAIREREEAAKRQQEAIAAERQRVADEARAQAADDAARAQDRENRAQKHRAIVQALLGLEIGLSEAQAKDIVKALASGALPAVTIGY